MLSPLSEPSYIPILFTIPEVTSEGKIDTLEHSLATQAET
jgi:hypothetical protein